MISEAPRVPVTHSRRWRRARLALVVLPVAFTAVHGQAIKADSIAHQIRELQEAQSDPTTPILLFTHAVTYIPSYYGDEFHGKSAWTYQFAGGVPFTLWGVTNVVRANVGSVLSGPEPFTNPSVTHLITGSHPSSSGLYRRWGIGTRFEAVPETDTIHGAHGLVGPELDYFGAFNEFVSGGITLGGEFGRSTSLGHITPTLQFAYGSWSLGTGKTIEYDFNGHGWFFVPVGLTLGYVAPIAHQYFDIFLTPAYDFSRDPGDPKWTLDLGVVITPRWFSPTK